MVVIKNKNSRKPLTLSIIIPVYNEENYLRACLNSIAIQSQMPLEVIIVDNNSTDDSVKIAQNYSFVTILRETRQHQSFAQKTGFDHARGDIIARIDADTILPPDWTQKITQEFSKNSAIVAVSGDGLPYDMYAKRLTRFLIARFYEIAAFCSGHKMLWGSNCAIRKTSWQLISSKVLLRSDIWEDYDLAFCVAKTGTIKSLNNIPVGMSLRSGQKPLLNQLEYQSRAVRTYYLQAGLARTILFIILWLPMSAVYIMIVIDRLIRWSRYLAKIILTSELLKRIQKFKIKMANISID